METPQDPAPPATGSVSDTPPTDRAERPQHEMLQKDLSKKAVAEALDEFDGDEN